MRSPFRLFPDWQRHGRGPRFRCLQKVSGVRNRLKMNKRLGRRVVNKCHLWIFMVSNTLGYQSHLEKPRWHWQVAGQRRRWAWNWRSVVRCCDVVMLRCNVEISDLSTWWVWEKNPALEQNPWSPSPLREVENGMQYIARQYGFVMLCSYLISYLYSM